MNSPVPDGSAKNESLRKYPVNVTQRIQLFTSATGTAIPMSDFTKPKWFVYVIQTDRNALYTGITTDVTRRFQEHLAVFERLPNPRGARFFRTQKPVCVVYAQQFGTRSEATRQELLIKKMPRPHKLALLNEPDNGMMQN